MPHPLPRHVKALKRLGLLRDFIVMLVGLCVLIAIPPSIGHFGGDFVASLAWSLLPLVGGTLALIGLHYDHRSTEVIGCFTVATGFLIWAVAAALSPTTAPIVTMAVAGAFFVLCLDFLLRALIVQTGRLDRSA